VVLSDAPHDGQHYEVNFISDNDPESLRGFIVSSDYVYKGGGVGGWYTLPAGDDFSDFSAVILMAQQQSDEVYDTSDTSILHATSAQCYVLDGFVLISDVAVRGSEDRYVLRLVKTQQTDAFECDTPLQDLPLPSELLDADLIEQFELFAQLNRAE
jgi:hypothetical protein